MAMPLPPATSPAILKMEEVFSALAVSFPPAMASRPTTFNSVAPLMVLFAMLTLVSFFRSFQLPEPAPLNALPPMAAPAPTETIRESLAASPVTLYVASVEPVISAAMSFFT